MCNRRLEFIHTYDGFSGSVHDMRIFKYSGLQEMCLNYEGKCFPGNTHILADFAYTNQNHVFVPYKDDGQLTVEQRYYDKMLSSNRVFVECAIGLLEVEWRRMFYIIACRVLHNVALEPI